nr:MAG TPA: hypothetical protein [Caudoviricetes sp.]
MEETAECPDAVKASRLWRLIGPDAQRCRMRHGQTGYLMGADAVMKRCRGAIGVAKRTCEGLRETAGANVRPRAALPQSRRWTGRSSKRCAHV